MAAGVGEAGATATGLLGRTGGGLGRETLPFPFPLPLPLLCAPFPLPFVGLAATELVPLAMGLRAS